MNNTLKDIQKKLSDELCRSFSFYERQDKLHLISPFYFDDGDGVYIVIISNKDGSFTISDQGNTLMRLSYDLKMSQLEEGQRKEVMSYLIKRYNIEDRIGEYRITVGRDGLVNGIFNMIQFQIRMEDSVFSVEKQPKNTFIQDFQQKSVRHFTDHKVNLDWHDKKHDEENQYNVDILIKGKENYLAVFPMHTDYNLLNNTVTIHQVRQWHPKFKFFGVVDNRSNVGKTNVRKFTDASDKIYFYNRINEDRLFNNFSKLLAS